MSKRQSTIYICDGCQTEVQGERFPKYWAYSEVKLFEYDYDEMSLCQSEHEKKDLCAKCTETFKKNNNFN